MFRFRLAAVIITSFSFVLFLGVALYWGANQVAQYFQHSQTAYETFNDYERVSQQAYRYFKQRMDRLITGSADTDLEASKHNLYEAIQTLRNTATQAPPAEAKPVAEPDKPAELERVAHFIAFLDASEYQFNEVERLRRQGKLEMAMQALAKFSEQEIDGKFQPLIDAAINAERQKANKARRELEDLLARSRGLAILASLTAALFCLGSGLLLLRGFRKPIEALMKGTDEIASGNLDYRIALESPAEFAYLAGHFNQMAQELELQQNKLREGRAVLERRVAERTFELHRLNDELKRMDSARLEFLADISHELRTPITVIRGEAEVTLRGRDRDAGEYKDTLQRIAELSMQLGTYVNDLLFLARAETASLQFSWDNLNLSDLVSNAVENFRVMVEEKGLTVTLEAPGKPVWVYGDRQRLLQLLFILGDNACRYSNPGGQITVSLWRIGGEVGFSLSDQGIGIPSQDLDRIFDRRFRSKNAQHSREDGSGLGLPMAKAIVKAHGGEISVASIENLGSTFTVTLPLISAEPDENRINE